MARERNFDELWHLALTQGKSRNDIAYHSCCDVWTTRGVKKVRASHVKKLRWKELMASLESNGEEDKKTLLRAKMAEERWRVPVVINEVCKLAMMDDTKRKDKNRENHGETDSVQADQETQRTFTLHGQSTFDR